MLGKKEKQLQDLALDLDPAGRTPQFDQISVEHIVRERKALNRPPLIFTQPVAPCSQPRRQTGVYSLDRDVQSITPDGN